MSLNPFVPDPRIAERFAESERRAGAHVRADIAQLLAERGRNPGDNLGGVILASEVEQLIGRHCLSGAEDLMLLALDSAKSFAHPPISDFHVVAVGLEAETGNLLLGGNVEFPGTHLGLTLHGEGFVFTRAFSRGTRVSVLAIGEAHPCAHCRQYLSEFAGSADLALIDPLGHRLTMAQLYPWPFDPAYLGASGAISGTVNWPRLAFSEARPGGKVSERLLRAGQRAYAPYSKCPGAVVLAMEDGGLITGAAIESVAFNPTVGPLQAAIVDLLAHGYHFDAITGAILGTVRGGAVDYGASTAELLRAVAPAARLDLAWWDVQSLQGEPA